MKIKKIEFSEDELNQIYDSLINGFDLGWGDIWTSGHSIEFDFNELISVESKLALYNEGYIESDTNADITVSQYVTKFELFFFYEGEEVTANSDCIEEKIKDHYRI